jgi:hypothetical protein
VSGLLTLEIDKVALVLEPWIVAVALWRGLLRATIAPLFPLGLLPSLELTKLMTVYLRIGRTGVGVGVRVGVGERFSLVGCVRQKYVRNMLMRLYI